MKINKLAASALAAVVVGAGAAACSTTVHTSPPSSPPPAASHAPATAPSSPAAPPSPAPVAQPVTVSGTGESVVTASGFVPGTTYKVAYTASGAHGANALIVEVVKSDGSTDFVVNDISMTKDITQDPPPLNGSTVYTPDSVTLKLHASNSTDEQWSLTFTPL